MPTIKWEATLADGRVIQQGRTPYQDIFTQHLPVREFRFVNRDNGAVLVQVPVQGDDRIIYRFRPPLTLNLRSGQRVPSPEGTHPLWIAWLQRRTYSIEGREVLEHIAFILDEVTLQVSTTRDLIGLTEMPGWNDGLYDCEKEAGVLPPVRLVHWEW